MGAPRYFTKTGEIEYLWKLYCGGMSLKDIGDRFGVRRETVQYRLKAAGYQLRPKDGRLLSDEAELRVASEYLAGKPITILARENGVNTTLIWTLLKRRGVRGGRPVVRQYPLDEAAFDNAENSEQASYFVGLLLADGCVMRREPRGNKREYWAIKLSLNGDDGAMVDRFRLFLKTDHPLYIETNRKNAFSTSKRTTTLVVHSAQLAKDLMFYGVNPRKSLTAQPSPKLTGSPHFWRGVIDGDGSLGVSNCNAPRVDLVGSFGTCVSFLDYVRSFCPTTTKVAPAVNIWRVTFGARTAYQVIKRLYSECTIALPRKLARAEQLLRDHDRFAR